MAWQVSVLPDAEKDLDALFGADKSSRTRLEESIRKEFSDFKGQRLTKFFQGGSSSTSIDRLEGSEFVGSIRFQVFADYRATALCLPDLEHAFIAHVFHKGQDPKYRNAVRVHDKRVQALLDRFRAVDERRRK